MARRGALSGGAIHEDFRPVSEWKYDKEAQQPYFLLIKLPDFSKEQIKVSTEGTNTLRIRGERLIGRNRWSRFEEDFRIPDDCNIRGIRAKFESSTLTITMPKKGPPITTTLVSPKKEQTQKEKLEAPLIKPDNEKREKIEQETKENESAKVMEKVKEAKMDEVVKEDTFKKENEKELVNPKNEKIEKKDEKIEEVKEKDIDKGKKVAEGINIGKESTKESEGDGMEKGTFKPEYYFKNIEKIVMGKELKEKEIKKHDEVVDGIKMGNIVKEEGKEKENEVLKPEYHLKNFEKKITSEELKEKQKKKYEEVADEIKMGSIAKKKGKEKEVLKPEHYTKKKEKYEEIMKSVAKGEEKQLIVNMGVAVLVIVALGAYIYYGSFKKG